ncbi:MAG: hypothetical protein LBP85_02630 [Prevotellaceae bacterium]|nr:hypothetical protein [Prevotellaceae bacterium]
MNIVNFRDGNGNNTIQAEIERNYNQIKTDVKQITESIKTTCIFCLLIFSTFNYFYLY